MNTTITVPNRIWLPLVAAGTALALAVGLLTFVVLQQQTAEPARPGSPQVETAATEIPQAEWAVETQVKGPKRIPKAERVRGEARAEQAAGVVQGIFDAVFLEPGEARDVISQSFTGEAAAALRDPGIGLPEGAEEVETTRRSVSVSVYSGTGSQAVARTVIAAKGLAAGEPFRLRQSALLWLVRDDGKWRVVAFEIDQRP